MNRQDLENKMFELGDGYDDGMVDLASELVAKLIRMVEAEKPAVNVVAELMARVDRWIGDRNFDEEEDRRWAEEHGL